MKYNWVLAIFINTYFTYTQKYGGGIVDIQPIMAYNTYFTRKDYIRGYYIKDTRAVVNLHH